MDSSRDLPTCPQPLRLPQQDISIELKQRTFLTSFDIVSEGLLWGPLSRNDETVGVYPVRNAGDQGQGLVGGGIHHRDVGRNYHLRFRYPVVELRLGHIKVDVVTNFELWQPLEDASLSPKGAADVAVHGYVARPCRGASPLGVAHHLVGRLPDHLPLLYLRTQLNDLGVHLYLGNVDPVGEGAFCGLGCLSLQPLWHRDRGGLLGDGAL